MESVSTTDGEKIMNKPQNILIKLLQFAIGVFMIYKGFENSHNLAQLYKILESFRFIPQMGKGLILIFIPGFQIATGLYLLFNAFSQNDENDESNLYLILFAYMLCSVCFLGIYTYASSKGCSACAKAHPEFDFKLWLPVFLYAIAAIFTALTVFLQPKNND